MEEPMNDGKDCPFDALILEVWKYRDQKHISTDIAICGGSVRQKLPRRQFRWGDQSVVCWEPKKFWPHTIGIKCIALTFSPLGDIMTCASLIEPVSVLPNELSP